MPRPDFPTSIPDFQRRFGTEEACLAYMIQSRWPEGFVCPRCHGTEAYNLSSRGLLECKACRYQASVTSGTVMHKTKQPLTSWFWAAYLVTTVTPGMSAIQFQRQMGLSRYETAFQMLHKLRAAMVKEGRERLRGVVEVDETFVGAQSHGGKTGRGAEGKMIVVGAVEVREGRTKSGRVFHHAGRVRLRVVPKATSEVLIGFLRESVEEGTIVRTDGYRGYLGVQQAGYDHRPEVAPTPRAAAEEVFPHIHRVFSNLKAWLIGTHHGAVRLQHLQAYLNEFTFRFNRRKVPMAAFQTVLGLMNERDGPTYERLYGVARGEPGAWVHPNHATYKGRP